MSSKWQSNVCQPCGQSNHRKTKIQKAHVRAKQVGGIGHATACSAAGEPFLCSSWASWPDHVPIVSQRKHIIYHPDPGQLSGCMTVEIYYELKAILGHKTRPRFTNSKNKKNEKERERNIVSWTWGIFKLSLNSHFAWRSLSSIWEKLASLCNQELTLKQSSSFLWMSLSNDHSHL